MSEVSTDLKALRLHGMASAWMDLISQGTTELCLKVVDDVN